MSVKGEPIQIVKATDNHTFELDEERLEEVLLRPDVRNKKVAVVSVAGAFRKGKSFLLDFFLRYLNTGVRVHLKYFFLAFCEMWIDVFCYNLEIHCLL